MNHTAFCDPRTFVKPCTTGVSFFDWQGLPAQHASACVGIALALVAQREGNIGATMSAAGMISLNWRRGGNASSDDLCVVSDETLVAAAKNGHSGAFDDLYKRHAEKMFRITYRITRNREDAEDAVQECFLKVFLHLKNLDGMTRISTCLTRIAINAALMRLRKNHASREASIDQSVETTELCWYSQPSDC